MNPQSPPDPDSCQRQSSTSSSKSRLLNMMTPMVLLNNLLATNSSSMSSYRETMNSISTQVSDGFRDFTGEVCQGLRRFNCWNSKHYAQYDSHDSIGSRGYDQFKESCESTSAERISLSTSSVPGSVYNFE